MTHKQGTIAPRKAFDFDQAASTAFAEAIHMAERARLDAFRDMSWDIPDPVKYARYLPVRFAEALEGARSASYRVTPAQAKEMRSYGLVECGGTCLTAFGIAVRRALVEGLA